MSLFKNRIPDWLLLVIIIAVGATLRTLCATNGDFWLDEIWSYNIAFERSLSGIILFSHDNNHILNTIFIHLIGPSRNVFLYRILPLLCGISSLLIIYFTPIYKSRVEKFITLTIFSVSYFFVSYSGEARGYAYLILFLSASFYLLNKIFKDPERRIFYILFWTVSILGILSHYLYITFYIAGLIWTILHKKKISTILKLYLIPTIFYVILYFVLIVGMQRGGGDIIPAIIINNQAFKVLLGFGLPASICFFIYLYVLVSKPREDGSGIFYVSLFLLVPIAIFMRPNTIIYERYMLPFLFFFVFIISELIANLINARSKIVKVLGILFLLIIIISSIRRDIELYVYSKGNYTSAVTDLINNSNGKEHLAIAMNRFLINPTVFNFYLDRIKTNKPSVELSDINDVSASKADWLIYNSKDHLWEKEADNKPAEEIVFKPNIKFKLFKTYGYDHGLSGWEWVLYKREQPENTIKTKG